MLYDVVAVLKIVVNIVVLYEVGVVSMVVQNR